MTIIGQMSIDDEEWHTIEWSRSSTNAELFIDTILVQSSDISECQLNTVPKLYIGGTNPLDSRRVIESIVREKH
jgi:hypothetical protein